MSEKKHKILIVDDQPDNVFLLEVLLKKNSDFEIDHVENGLMAFEYVHEKPVDLILMDVMMPEMDGNLATQKIRETHDQSELPIIMVTTLSDTDNLVKSFKAGANDYVSKPIDVNVLNARVQAGLRTREAVLEQRRQTLNAERLNQKLKQFSFAVAHDIRNPLAHIQVLWGALEEELMTAEEVGEQIKGLANKVTEFMDDILNQLAFAGDWDFEDVDLNLVLEDVTKFLSIPIEEKKAELEYETLPVIQGNRGLIFQLLLNIISNALKYTKEDGTPKVQVNCVEQPLHYLISVSDNGRGMSPEDLDIVKSPLARGSSSEGTKGTGLGLSLSRNVMEEVGGKMDIESTLGEGTTIHLSFPKQPSHQN